MKDFLNPVPKSPLHRLLILKTIVLQSDLHHALCWFNETEILSFKTVSRMWEDWHRNGGAGVKGWNPHPLRIL